MIDIISNSTSFRKIPHQSGIYSVEFDVNLTNHFNNIDFALSGAGSIFFRFGSNSGHYYASGVEKLYFDSTSPDTNLSYDFIIANTSYDVYKDDVPLILNATKSTGTLEKIFNNNTANANGQFSLILRGNRPSFRITSGMTFPTNTSFVDNVVVYNNSSVPFNILSGTADTIGFISGINRLPLFLPANGSGLIPFSGRLNGASNQNISLIINADYVNTPNVLSITGTQFSGSGYIISAPSPATIGFGGFDNVLWFLSNTGTTPLRFSPVISQISTGINITVPTYSGVEVFNYFSGFFDTPSQFFFSDKITWSGGAFYIIQENPTGISLINTTGDSVGGVTSGLFVGTNVNLSVGQSFSFPFDLSLTGVSLNLAVTGSGFIPSDTIFVNIYGGNGVSGSVMSSSDSLNCQNIPTGISNGQLFNFRFPTPISLFSGSKYSIGITGAPSFVGNVSSSPSRQVILLSTTGNVYAGGSGFIYNGSTTFTTGDAIMRIDWMPPLNSHRYHVNSVAGAMNQFYKISTGIYDKYQSHLSFSFNENNLEALPGSPMNFEMTYDGIVSGMNFARLTFDNIGYSTIISGLTT